MVAIILMYVFPVSSVCLWDKIGQQAHVCGQCMFVSLFILFVCSCLYLIAELGMRQHCRDNVTKFSG